MKQSSFLAWVYRMPLIQRWGLMHCFKPENIAEHSHQVAVSAHLLTIIKNKHFGGNLNPDRAATLGLYHEISETKTQDLNQKTKYHNPEFTRQFKKLEAIAEQECLSSLPGEFQETFEGLVVQNNVDAAYKPIIKAADILSAYIKTIDELRYGNGEFTQVKINLEEKLKALTEEMPEVRYFLDVFVDDCGLTIDKLLDK